ncbi:hypothetical protein, partial [Novacetimonas cocois]|uniref:hypothetical protein n=1 Tax=Novacetimonas cocois TaxID=1747507 RepID=UPI00197F4640
GDIRSPITTVNQKMKVFWAHRLQKDTHPQFSAISDCYFFSADSPADSPADSGASLRRYNITKHFHCDNCYN